MFIVVEENTDYADVIGGTAMVYLDSLAHEYGSATQYYADAHPSIGNYFMMIVGDTITDNDGYSSIVTKDNIAAARGRRHESTLRLSAEVLGLTTFPNHAAGAPDIAEFFEP